MLSFTYLNQVDAHNLLRISKFFDQQSSFVRNELKVGPYLETVNVSFTFIWDDRKIEDRAKVSTSPLFGGLLVNNIELRDILTKTKCMQYKYDLK